MFAGRNVELNFLNEHFNAGESEIVVVYGVRGVGKTAIIKEFVKDKDYSYYAARACSATEQLYEWSLELEGDMISSDYINVSGYTQILKRIFPEDISRKILILDEFQYLVKGSDSFFNELVSFVNNRKLSRPVCIILISSAPGWVENSMVKSIGGAAAYISGFLKVRELPLYDMMQAFSDYKAEDLINNYIVLGGIPGLWKSFDKELSFKDNIIKNVLCKESRLYEEMSVYLNEDLREPAVYSTILVTIARGFCKLNEIYEMTGFSRAKISVYLKNLMELDLIEKIYAGVYRITNPYVKFYFRFLFSNRSQLELLSAEEFYDLKVRDYFKSYAVDDYSKICRQMFASQLPEDLAVEEWRDKDGFIDIVAVDDDNNRVVGKCIFDRVAEVSDYEQLLKDAKRAKIKVDRAIIFAEEGVSDELYELSENGKVELQSIV